jgi:hypothetical protein
MMKLLALVTLATALPLPANAQTGTSPLVTFQMVEMDPPSPAILHNNDHVYVRVQYETTAPLRVEMQLFDHGARATKQHTNGEVLLQPGQGETLAWFAFPGPGSVDGIRLSARVNDRNLVTSQDLKVSYIWDGRRSTGENRAPWVGPLLTQDERRQQAAFAEMETRVGAGGFGSAFGMLAVSLLGVVALGAIAACVAWPLWGIIRWEGAWKAAAALPFAAIVLWGLKDASDLMIDRTSHNLLPFEFVIAACGIVPYMVVVALVRHVRLKHHRRRAPLS